LLAQFSDQPTDAPTFESPYFVTVKWTDQPTDQPTVEFESSD
jgi:hypothetical protein